MILKLKKQKQKKKEEHLQAVVKCFLRWYLIYFWK